MYSLIIPPELVSELYHIREKTGKSIRMQILDAIRSAIRKFREMEENTSREFNVAHLLYKTNGGEKNGTARKKL